MRYARALCYVGEREREEEREGEGRKELVRFHVTGDTMTLYVSLNIFHRREPREDAARTISNDSGI